MELLGYSFWRANVDWIVLGRAISSNVFELLDLERCAWIRWRRRCTVAYLLLRAGPGWIAFRIVSGFKSRPVTFWQHRTSLRHNGWYQNAP
eukprot:scaffold39580_cov62-Attheya_sp.AAC.3